MARELSPFEELCHKLDELGVEYDTYELPNGNHGVSWIDGNDIEWEAVPLGENFEIHALQLVTPEQAIAATVGTEPDEQDMLKLHDRMNAALLDMQEELLAYHPRDRENASSKKLIDCVIAAHQIIEDAATVGVGTCHYDPDGAGFTWYDENDVEHYEEYSASDECYSASCDKCGFSMMVGDDGWFDGWDEITEWTEEDGSEHKGYILKPRFERCPRCGRKVTE